MSAPTPTAALDDLRTGWTMPTMVAVSTVGFALAWRFLPVGIDVLLTCYVLLVGLIVVSSLTSHVKVRADWTQSVFATIGRQAELPPRSRATDLMAFEEIVVSALRYEHDLYLKMRPPLRELALARLRARGIDLDDERAPALLGELDALVRNADGGSRTLFGPGVSIETLSAMVKRLEEL